MKLIAASTLITLAACATDVSASRPLTVEELIQAGDQLNGRRVQVRGRLSQCQPLSCGITGTSEHGADRYLSIGQDEAFDKRAVNFANQVVTLEVTVTRHCMADINQDVVVICTDRPATLINPVFR